LALTKSSNRARKRHGALNQNECSGSMCKTSSLEQTSVERRPPCCIWAVLLFTGFWCVEQRHIKMKINQSERRHKSAAGSRPHPIQSAPDFTIYGSGSVYLFEPLTETAQAWMANHCPAGKNHQYLGRNLAIEFRYVDEIVHLAIRDGLTPPTKLSAEGRRQ
jgi:hypothetical protein